jgi:hypothetical protein
MIKTFLINPSTRRALDIQNNSINDSTLMSLTDKSAYGQFKAVGRSTAGTSTIVSPPQDGAIVLTDLLVSADRVSSSTLLIQFSDGVIKIPIFRASGADAPTNIAIPFAGRWRGWKNASLELITVATINVTVAVGYFKIPAVHALSYSDWDKAR